MSKLRKIALVVLLVLVLFPVSGYSEVKLKTGQYLRLRHEYWRNLFDLETDTKDNRNFFRIKASLWGKLSFTDDISLFTKLTDEFRSYMYFRQANGKKRPSFDINEVVFDNLYLDVKNFLDMPLDLRIGRQDFLFTHGEGFLIMDGTSLDGSRTFYFNAAKATWNVDEASSLDLIYLNNHREDDILEVFNELSPHQQLNYTDEEAFMVYYKGKPKDDLNFEGYYIFKEEDEGGPRMQAQKTELNTVGSFVKYNFDPWAIKGQAAYQFGDYGVNDREGFGGYVFLDRNFKNSKWSPSLRGGFVYLSGDDTGTAENEAWDPLFSRWPWMSELYCLTYNGESGLAYWTNLQMWRTKLTLKPTEKSKLSFWYNFLRANENVAGALFDTGKNRGHLPQIRFDYKFNKNISTYILAEYFRPGSFYNDGTDNALFLRTELTFKF